jgi:hypothetical protein
MGDLLGRETKSGWLRHAIFREATAASRRNGALTNLDFQGRRIPDKKLAREFALNVKEEGGLQRRLVLSTHWRREMNCDQK